MSVQNNIVKVVNNKEKILLFCCFWGALCFNVGMIGVVCCQMFIYDGGANDPKSYYDITNIEKAHTIFLQDILENLKYGLLYSIWLIWSCFFTKRINLNAILIQLLPTMIVLGFLFFAAISENFMNV